MFLTTPTFTSTTTEEYRYIQSADPLDMQTRFLGFLSALAIENVARVQQQLTPFNVIDVDIAGGGDGHTFVVKFLLSTQLTGQGWDGDDDLDGVGVACWMASDEQGLAARQGAAIALLKNGFADVTNVAVGFAGAAKGTRFMAFIAGVQIIIT